MQTRLTDKSYPINNKPTILKGIYYIARKTPRQRRAKTTCDLYANYLIMWLLTWEVALDVFPTWRRQTCFRGDGFHRNITGPSNSCQQIKAICYMLQMLNVIVACYNGYILLHRLYFILVSTVTFYYMCCIYTC